MTPTGSAAAAGAAAAAAGEAGTGRQFKFGDAALAPADDLEADLAEDSSDGDDGDGITYGADAAEVSW